MAESVERRDVELVKRLATGDEGAFLEFYQRYQGGLYRYAVHMSGTPEAGADIVQETFLTLIRNTQKFDEERGTPAAFLYGIARNHLRKLREKEGRYVPFIDEADEVLSSDRKAPFGHSNGNGHAPDREGRTETVLEDLERMEITELLREAVATLPDHYREPLTLCDLEGKSYIEVAALLRCPVGTVRSRLNRARSILLDKLRPARIGSRSSWTRSGGTR